MTVLALFRLKNLWFIQVFEDELTPSVLRTPSIPRTAGAEYLLRGKAGWSRLRSSPYAGGLEGVLWFTQVFEDELGLASGEMTLVRMVAQLHEICFEAFVVVYPST